MITVTTTSPEPDRGDFASAPSAPSSPGVFNDLNADRMGTQAGPADANIVHGDGSLRANVRAKPLRNNGKDGADGADANFRPQSEPEKIGTAGWSARL